MSRYNIDSPEKYSQLYKESVNKPEVFWSELASNNFMWESKWSKVLDWDFRKAKVSWFKDAKLNITINCLGFFPITPSPLTTSSLFNESKITQCLELSCTTSELWFSIEIEYSNA